MPRIVEEVQLSILQKEEKTYLREALKECIAEITCVDPRRRLQKLSLVY